MIVSCVPQRRYAMVALSLFLLLVLYVLFSSLTGSTAMHLPLLRQIHTTAASGLLADGGSGGNIICGGGVGTHC